MKIWTNKTKYPTPPFGALTKETTTMTKMLKITAQLPAPVGVTTITGYGRSVKEFAKRTLGEGTPYHILSVKDVTDKAPARVSKATQSSAGYVN